MNILGRFREHHSASQPRSKNGKFTAGDGSVDGTGDIGTGVKHIRAVADAMKAVNEMSRSQSEAFKADMEARRAELELMLDAQPDGDENANPLDSMLMTLIASYLQNPKMLQPPSQVAQSSAGVANQTPAASAPDNAGEIIKQIAGVPDKMFNRGIVDKVCAAKGINPSDLERAVKKLSKVYKDAK